MKSALHLEREMPLMAQLGQQQKALLMQETEVRMGWEEFEGINSRGM